MEALLRSEEVAEALINSTLDLLAEDRARGLWFLPVRHHSPACALHVARVIDQVRPKEVLIEGPEDLTRLIPFMLDPKTRTPFAAYCTYVDLSRRIGRGGGFDFGPARFGGYYPFCEYSPELVALRRGAAAGAKLAFVDLTYPEKILVSRDEHPGRLGLEVESLLEEGYLARSRYLDRLAARTGCRDHDDLWDHLFEVRGPEMASERFIDEVAAYCVTSRLEFDPRALELEGNLARERHMAAHVADALRRGATPIVVVTGGFHTVELPLLVRDRPQRRRPEAGTAPGESSTALMRYSFDQLDALNGYSAGMPAPGYYDRVWAHLDRGTPAALARAAAEVLVDLGRATRKRRRGPAVSTAQEADALQHALRLAALRGRSGPSREDVLDAIRSCFVKGPLDAEGALVMAEVQRRLAGARVGFVPPEAGSPPIVDDFYRRAAELRLDVGEAAPRDVTLDLYRSRKHRRVSRFLRALRFIDVPLAEVLGGPDFAGGEDLERIQEIWRYCWTPLVESALVERMAYGATVAEAAAAVLDERLARLEEQGQARSAGAATKLLVEACRIGLFERVEAVMTSVRGAAADDPSFVSLVQALRELALLWQSREPLEAYRIPGLSELIKAVYARACFVIGDLADPGQERSVLAGFTTVRGLLTPHRADLLDRDLFFDALGRLVAGTDAIAGGAAAHLFLEGRLGEARLLSLTTGAIGGAERAAGSRAAYLRGLLTCGREIAWRVPGLIDAISELLGSFDEDDFNRALPELRLAFADLTPKETDRVAALVGRVRSGDAGDVFAFDATDEELAVNTRISGRAREVLVQDGLKEWT